MTEKKLLGTFEVISGHVIISDPCYESNRWQRYETAKKGLWKAFVIKREYENWGLRQAELIAYHEDHIEEDDWYPRIGQIGVDSGSAGVFEQNHYRDDSVVKDRQWKYSRSPIDKDDLWYSLCCDITLSQGAGVIPHGCVSSSGLGDGGYDYFVIKDINSLIEEVVAIKIVFLD